MPTDNHGRQIVTNCSKLSIQNNFQKALDADPKKKGDAKLHRPFLISLVGTNEWRCLDHYFAVHSQPGSTSHCQHFAALDQVLQLPGPLLAKHLEHRQTRPAMR